MEHLPEVSKALSIALSLVHVSPLLRQLAPSSCPSHSCFSALCAAPPSRRRRGRRGLGQPPGGHGAGALAGGGAGRASRAGFNARVKRRGVSGSSLNFCALQATSTSFPYPQLVLHCAGARPGSRRGAPAAQARAAAQCQHRQGEGSYPGERAGPKVLQGCAQGRKAMADLGSSAFFARLFPLVPGCLKPQAGWLPHLLPA